MFPRLLVGECFPPFIPHQVPTLINCTMLSRVQYQCHAFPRSLLVLCFPALITSTMLIRVHCQYSAFPRLLPVPCFPALITSTMLIRVHCQCHAYPRSSPIKFFQPFKASSMFYHTYYRLNVFPSCFIATNYMLSHAYYALQCFPLFLPVVKCLPCGQKEMVSSGLVTKRYQGSMLFLFLRRNPSATLFNSDPAGVLGAVAKRRMSRIFPPISPTLSQTLCIRLCQRETGDKASHNVNNS